MFELLGLVILIVSLGFFFQRRSKTQSFIQRPQTFGSDLKMVMVVRHDLKMGTGKIAAQCCHACLGLYKSLLTKDLLRIQAWEKGYYKKIVLKCPSEEEMLKIAAAAAKKNLDYYIVRDAGLTQIAPGSKTVLSIGPASEDELKDVTSHLKLL
jgi:peptidyl-tRNA hydrolase